ncbi:DUF6090 family protein [Bizionia arctica]|uniref:Uncharacterized protein n=1 Tax=Bizionia arctica TaxID=1495645 RepID=A0A917LTU9_9FLAO|nr:DUF6090 family protein [Bizionia arctica]GGG57079.1 hypothetical protein GCM10010976_29890 [Bizionia arctica]
MDTGKTSKYFKYAIGEIILVVIGILIALQINNWNEARKANIFEKDILELIDQNLKIDSIALSVELTKAKQAILLTNRLLEKVSQKDYSDSLNFWMGKIISFERFKSQSSAFEVLKAKGIENISDKDLQLGLISYYDEHLFNVYESLNDVLGSFNNDWIPVVKTDFVDFKFREYCTPIDSQVFFEKPSTIILFKLYKDNRSGEVQKMESALAKTSEIRTIIKKNLK